MDEPSSGEARDAFMVGYALTTGRARSGHSEGDVESARGALLTAIRAEDPEWSPRASYTLGEFLWNQGDAAGAQEALEVALAAGHPEWTPGAQIVAGVVAASRGDRAAAVAAYRAAIDSGHRVHAPAAWFNLGTLHQQSGAVDDAVAAYEFAMASDQPALRAKAAVNLGFVLFTERGDLDEARQAFEAAVAAGDPEQTELARQSLAALDVPAAHFRPDAAVEVIDDGVDVSVGHGGRQVKRRMWVSGGASPKDSAADLWAAADLSAEGAELDAADNLPGAAAAHEGAAERYRTLLDAGIDDPVRVRALLSRALSSQAAVVSRQDRFGEALELAHEAVQLVEPLVSEDAEIWTDAYITLLITLSGIQAMAGHMEDAFRTSTRAGAMTEASSPPLPPITRARAARTIAEIRLRAGTGLDVAEIALNRCIATLAELVTIDPSGHSADLYAAVELQAALMDRLDADDAATALRAWAADRHLDAHVGEAAGAQPEAISAVLAAILPPRIGPLADTNPLDMHGGDSAEAVAASEAGLAAFENGDPETSERHLRRADELGGRGGVFRLGFLLEERGDQAGAEAAYRRAMRRGSEPAAGNLGTMLRRRGDRDGARRCYEIALALGSTSAQQELTSMGYTVITGADGFVVETSAFDEIAATIMDDARARQPLPPGMQVPGTTKVAAGAIAKTLIGNALHANAAKLAEIGGPTDGDANGAENHYREAFAEAGPSRVRYAIAFNLGLLLVRFGDPMDESVELLRFAQSSGHPELVGKAGRTLAVELGRRGRVADAMSALQLAADAGHAEESPAALLQMAVLKMTNGDHDGACRDLTRAAQSRHPVHAPQAAAALQQIDDKAPPSKAYSPFSLSRLFRRRE